VSGKPKIFANNLGGSGGVSASGVGCTTDEGGGLGGGAVAFGICGFVMGVLDEIGDDMGDDIGEDMGVDRGEDMSFPSESELIS
jgi:hypothetical protein